jgi:hypothetical protein
MEWPRRIVTGWSPREVCTACGEGRRPVAQPQRPPLDLAWRDRQGNERDGTNGLNGSSLGTAAHLRERTITGYACACSPPTEHGPDVGAGEAKCKCGRKFDTWRAQGVHETAERKKPTPQSAPTTPGIVLDPFGGTGTTALVAHALGRHGISVDMSADYCRLAQWRTSDPKELARAQQREYTPPREQVDGQATFEFEEEPA